MSRELEMRLNIVDYVSHHRDKQVRESLNWYNNYRENHVRFMYDYPEFAKEIENMQKIDYHKYLLDKAFEGFYK